MEYRITWILNDWFNIFGGDDRDRHVISGWQFTTGGLVFDWLSGQRLVHVYHKSLTLNGGQRRDNQVFCGRRGVAIGSSELVCISGK